jgi:hypothetical protein
MFILHMKKAYWESDGVHQGPNENFDGYFLAKRTSVTHLKHVKQWLNQFIDLHNGELINILS